MLTLVWPAHVTRITQAITDAIFSVFGSAFLVSVSLFVVLCLWLAVSKYGRIRLGPEDSSPDFSTASWLSMLFAAGMGTGLVVWGVSEPVYHLLNPPSGTPATADTAAQAFLITNFHWGIHAWAIYGIGALTLAYFSFVKGGAYLPSTPIRLGFAGQWTGWVGAIADLLAILAVTFGVAGSMAMGILLVHAGLHHVFGLPAESIGVDIAIMGVLFTAYMLSASTGLDKGIRILSNINMAVAILLVFAFLFLGPTQTLLGTFFDTLTDYAAQLIPISTTLQPFDASQKWVSAWSVFYFVWWIAWTPFVGSFIARISRGRTIREFIIGVLLCPTLFSLFWFAVFGGMATDLQLTGAHDFTAGLKNDIMGLVYQLGAMMPGAFLIGVVITVLVFIFLVTSVDSATFVLAMLTSGGDLNPSANQKLIWGVILGLLGAGFTFVGDIDVIKVLTIFGAIPFMLVLLLQIVALFSALRERASGDSQPISEVEEDAQSAESDESDASQTEESIETDQPKEAPEPSPAIQEPIETSDD